ncbi:hemerythrin domain-containing protein [Neisseriaceae bacterium TC5R-5]|nr:hemerythrin domain-containing protein [Neisseriaceae bacterium TC5R-5]
MLSLNTLTGSTAPGFDEPLEMLQACHTKIYRFCEQLEQLPDYITQYGLDEAARNSIDSVVRYFDQAVPEHHTDEEEELFPLLLERVATAAARLEQLSAEHGYLTSSWDTIREDLLALRDGQISFINKGELEEFARQYRDHAAAEEAWLFPTVTIMFTPEELEAAGQRMAARRQKQG